MGKLVSLLARNSTQKKLAKDDLEVRLIEVNKRFPIPQDPREPPLAPVPVESIPGFF